MISIHRKLLPLVLLLLLASFASAQTYRGSIRGTVTDPNNAVVPAASVSLASKETNEQRTSVTNATGEYTISSLPPGRYTLKIAAGGFETLSQDIALNVNQELRVDVSLVVGQVATDSNMIISRPSDLKKDSSSIGTVIENNQIVGLPLDGRNFYELTLLVPGAVPAAQGSAGSVRGDFAFSVNGAREDANNFLLDGVYNVDP
jgi:hypothetical protein